MRWDGGWVDVSGRYVTMYSYPPQKITTLSICANRAIINVVIVKFTKTSTLESLSTKMRRRKNSEIWENVPNSITQSCHCCLIAQLLRVLRSIAPHRLFGNSGTECRIPCGWHLICRLWPFMRYHQQILDSKIVVIRGGVQADTQILYVVAQQEWSGVDAKIARAIIEIDLVRKPVALQKYAADFWDHHDIPTIINSNNTQYVSHRTWPNSLHENKSRITIHIGFKLFDRSQDNPMNNLQGNFDSHAWMDTFLYAHLRSDVASGPGFPPDISSRLDSVFLIAWRKGWRRDWVRRGRGWSQFSRHCQTLFILLQPCDPLKRRYKRHRLNFLQKGRPLVYINTKSKFRLCQWIQVSFQQANRPSSSSIYHSRSLCKKANYKFSTETLHMHLWCTKLKQK